MQNYLVDNDDRNKKKKNPINLSDKWINESKEIYNKKPVGIPWNHTNDIKAQMETNSRETNHLMYLPDYNPQLCVEANGE